jgi:hypothetical protein
MIGCTRGTWTSLSPAPGELSGAARPKCRDLSYSQRLGDWAAAISRSVVFLGAAGQSRRLSCYGIGNSAPVALGYLIVAGCCYALNRQDYAEVVISPEAPAHAVGED